MTQSTWRKSTYSSGNADCVELATADDAILLRDSKHPEAGHFTFTRPELAAFVAGAKAGEFDDMV
jgi:Domain of unknown function (DUF397)